MVRLLAAPAGYTPNMAFKDESYPGRYFDATDGFSTKWGWGGTFYYWEDDQYLIFVPDNADKEPREWVNYTRRSWNLYVSQQWENNNIRYWLLPPRFIPKPDGV